MSTSQPRVLIWDAELTPALVWTWSAYEANALRIEKDQRILCFAYRWLGEKKIHVVRAGLRGDKQAVRILYKLFNEADVILAYNGDAFDQKHANTRFLVHGLPPPSHYQSIDPLKVNRKYFKHLSNKMDEVARVLGLERKVQHAGMSLWFDCMAGDKKAWKQMDAYNRQDVQVLTEIYATILPWIENHPNMNHFTTDVVCPKCGSDNWVRQGVRRSISTIRRTYQCKDCWGWFSDKKALSSAQVK